MNESDQTQYMRDVQSELSLNRQSERDESDLFSLKIFTIFLTNISYTEKQCLEFTRGGVVFTVFL